MTQTQHPTADVVTTTALVVLQDRPVVPLSPWLLDAAAHCAESSRLLQLVTPDASVLTAPAGTMLATQHATWAVRSDDGSYVDGLRGFPLRWDGSCFRAVERSTLPDTDVGIGAGSDADMDVDGDLGGCVEIEVTSLHAATAGSRIGEVVEDMLEVLAGGATGWGVAEPATQRWDVEELTRLCRDRAPRPTTLVVVGGGVDRRGVGTVHVSRVPSGVREHVRLLVDGGPVPDPDALDALAREVASRRDVQTMLVGLRPGRRDCTVPPRPAPTLPYGVLIGAGPVREFGVPDALASPAASTELVGPMDRIACWLRLPGTGGPGDLSEVLRHFSGEDSDGRR